MGLPFADQVTASGPPVASLCLRVRGPSGDMVAVAPRPDLMPRLAWVVRHRPDLAALLVVTTEAALYQAMVDRHAAELAARASEKLPDRLSARRLRRIGPKGLTTTGLTVAALAAVPLFPQILLLMSFLSVAAVRLGAATEAVRPPRRPEPLADGALPSVTVLVPLYREAAVVQDLVRNLSALDYPRDRLEVLVLMEADDRETQAAARRHLTAAPFRAVVVPDGAPRTKPRACNVGLALARGELVVVYDGEDRPEPDQLRVAAAALAADPRLAVVQARLACDHAAGAPLVTRLWALDYLALFGAVVPFLSRHGLPFLLGGTSNHFRRRALVEAGGWDAWNVTEDADLAVRLARLGWRSASIDSTTWEEAPVTVSAWVKQRGRWLKGFAVTALVHLRQPVVAVREMGVPAALALLVQLPLSLLSIAAHPVCLVLVAWGTLDGSLWQSAGSEAGDALLAAQAATLCVGYAAAFALHLAVLRRRPCRGVGLWLVPLLPLYWLLTSWALAVGLLDLSVRPHRWAKTAHGVVARPKGAPAGLDPRQDAPAVQLTGE
ncbi:glycosyltransferase [Methylopila musalis]|uniref:glycosyltransferase n=1 Tax=Methylopila musalis TaxID=1134781 RepID=UPI00366D3125